MLQVLTLPQLTVKVCVDYYDEKEKDKLLAYPTAGKIQEIVERGIQIPTHEFLTYYMFYQKRPGKPGYSNYDQLGQHYQKVLGDLEDWVDFNGHSIKTPQDVLSQPDTHLTERIGESVGLAIVNRIHNLSEADWDKIPAKGGINAPPVFDYEFDVASDQKHIVQVEMKGSCCENNGHKSSSVSHHKADIHRKKTKIAQLEKQGAYPFGADLRYGTITVIDGRQDSVLKCWLLDPDPEQSELKSRQLRFLNRVRFLRDWISFVSPRSQLAAALSTRVADLEAIADPLELDGIPLLKGNSEPFDVQTGLFGVGGHSRFFTNKSRVADGPAGGVVMRFSSDSLLFLGFREDLLVLATRQESERIYNYVAQVGAVPKTVECVLSESRFQTLNLPDFIVEEAQKTGAYYHFTLQGLLFYNRDGLVFGALPFQREGLVPQSKTGELQFEPKS